MRLDAFGYTTKRKGTNCFFVQPDVWDLLHYVQDQLQCQNTELLCEVHDHYVMQKALAEHNIWAYDFCLPFLLLQVCTGLSPAQHACAAVITQACCSGSHGLRGLHAAIPSTQGMTPAER